MRDKKVLWTPEELAILDPQPEPDRRPCCCGGCGCAGILDRMPESEGRNDEADQADADA